MRNSAHAQIILGSTKGSYRHTCCNTRPGFVVVIPLLPAQSCLQVMTAKRPRKLNLVDVWSETSKKRTATERDPELNNSAETETDMEDEGVFHTPEEQGASMSSSLPSTSSEWSAETSLESHFDNGSEVVSSCNSLCCSTDLKPYQPSNVDVLSMLTKGGRKFSFQWFAQYPWLTVCTRRKRAFCFYCKYAVKHSLVTFSKNSSPVFTDVGFSNWKKAHEKFSSHSISQAHKEA